jgi:hypothetical protein
MADPPSHFTPEELERWRFGSAQANLNNVLCHCRDHGTALWILCTNQIGGDNPDIESETAIVQPVVSHHLHLYLKLSVFFPSTDVANAHDYPSRAWAAKQTPHAQSGLSTIESFWACIVSWHSVLFSHFPLLQATVTIP